MKTSIETTFHVKTGRLKVQVWEQTLGISEYVTEDKELRDKIIEVLKSHKLQLTKLLVEEGTGGGVHECSNEEALQIHNELKGILEGKMLTGSQEQAEETTPKKGKK